jgi:hypothetical protein
MHGRVAGEFMQDEIGGDLRVQLQC